MSAARVDLVIDRLVVEGLDLTSAEADDLARRVERELRRLADPTARARSRHVALLEAKPLSLGEGSDPQALARVLAERIAAESGIALSEVGDDGRP